MQLPLGWAQTRDTWLLVGLALSLVGDLALIFPTQKAFLLGLMNFYAGQLLIALSAPFF